ncbi:MAG: LVIVD repeat-containing protein [Methylococcaceae bacterium]
MKKKQSIISGLMLLLMAMTSCTDKIYETFTANAPVYMSYEELRSAVKMSAPRDLKKPGKIYFKDQYVLINEMMEGVHVFDVSDPANPQNKGFIEIPGNVDIAIKDNILYADSYVDLVSIDVSNFDNVTETGRVQKVFPYTLPVYDPNYPIGKIEQEKGVVVGWEVKSIRQEIEQRYYPIYYSKGNYALDDASYSGGIGGASGSTTYGVGGSMARFALYENLLYIVNQSSVMTFKLKSSSEASLINTGYVGWNVETIYIADKHLFLGTQNGLIVQSLEVPERPTQIGTFAHMTSCDPVVIKGDLAFVTLKGGTTCRGGTLNQLDVVKMSDGYSKFSLLKSYPMYGPNGLGMDGDLLFICDGYAGLKIYNAADPLAITDHPIANFPSIHAYDIIPMSNYLFLIGEDGFLLYDYKNIQDIKQIGTIPVVK